MNIFTQLFSKSKRSPEEIRAHIQRDLLRQEAIVGRHVFGPIPKGHEREFFRVDSGTWVWQETWTDENGVKQRKHTKYSVREREIVKSVNSGSYERLSLKEVENFEAAVNEYVARVKKEVYQVGQPQSS